MQGVAEDTLAAPDTSDATSAWQTAKDAKGSAYHFSHFNQATGASFADNIFAATEFSNATSAWQTERDDQGRTYYFNWGYKRT